MRSDTAAAVLSVGSDSTPIARVRVHPYSTLLYSTATALDSTPPLLHPTLLYRYCTLLYSLIYSTLTSTLLHTPTPLYSILFRDSYSTPTAPFSTPPLLRSTLLHRCCTLLYSTPIT